MGSLVRGSRSSAALAGLATVVVVVAVAAARAAPSAPRSADASLDRALAKLVKVPGGPPGMIAVVQRGRRRIVIRHGLANRAAHTPIRVGDRWRIASVAKAFSGAVALSLVARGDLAVDDTIGKRLPDLPKAWRNVTLGEALQHRSGLPDFTSSPGWQMAARTRPHRPLEPLALVGFVADRPLDFVPGSSYHYSNTDNVVVGLFVEKATGLTYERALSEFVLDPLELRRTSMPPGYRMPAPYVHGYDNNVKGKREDGSELLSATLTWASGGMVSSPLDLTRFVRAYGGGKLFGGATRAAQLRFRAGSSEPPGPGVNEAGMGIFRYRTRCGTVYGHTGNFPGYTAFIATVPDGSRSVSMLANTHLSKGIGSPKVFAMLRNAFVLGVCAALEQNGR